MDLKTTFDGLELENPLMVASGPLNGDDKKIAFFASEGVGALTTKTISTKEPMIPKPCIYGGYDHVLNSELWSEYPLEKWTREFLPAIVKGKDRPLIVSVGYSEEDMETLIPELDRFADAFEVSTHYVGTDLDKIRHIVETIKKHTEKPVYMKISPHLPDPEGFAKTIREAGASGVVAINSLGPSMKVDTDKRSTAYGNASGYAWLSGPAIKPVALATVYRIKQAEPSLTVIGVGGIAKADDVLEFLLAGASAVQMLSAALIKGKQLYRQIIAALPAALEKHGFSSIQEVVDTQLTNTVSFTANFPAWQKDGCNRCRICEKACPYFAISYLEGNILFDHTKCSKCGLCAAICPAGVITFIKNGGMNGE
ncbi:MAG TPA: 4Fe-4S binding protein [Bacillota bacterium]|nr:4Fe-4S binding protein [Bacillota bacterium]HPF42537.1 4Fe-4S binding protein [Bacillota bacterium]HPJ86019.1 4Fe-4S binding protein [Bacillota bacterium]HPQ62038.1 4Fe-4S binding protein [Bacillota bacterium]HRX91550.1 4Fe-4S binding protein [Candidatus Izemoplasmatales bacterium]